MKFNAQTIKDFHIQHNLIKKIINTENNANTENKMELKTLKLKFGIQTCCYK